MPSSAPKGVRRAVNEAGGVALRPDPARGAAQRESGSVLGMPAIVAALFAFDFVLGLAYALDYVAMHPFSKLTSFVDLDAEGNLPTWYASVKWFCIAALLGLFACRNFRVADSRSWPLVLLPLLFLALSIDETAQIHEWLGHKSDAYLPNASRENTVFAKTGIWMFVLGIPFVVFFVLLVRSVRAYFRDAPGALFKMCLGVAVMLAGAIGIEALSNFVIPDSVYAMLQVLAEEVCENVGATIVFWGAWELLRRHGFSWQLLRAGG